MSAPDLLRALLAAPGPSGHEEEPSRIWREAASAFAEVSSDTMGSSFARVRAGDGAPTFVVMGHIDEIGVTITNVEDDGMLSFTPIGGMSPATLIGQRLELMTRDGSIPGVVERKRIPQDQLSDPPKPALADLHIDIGARDKDDAAARVRVGDAGVWAGAPVDLPNGRLLSRSLDNRLGAYIALEVARRASERDLGVDVV